MIINIKMKDNCLSYYNTIYHSKMRKKEIKLLFKKIKISQSNIY